MYFCYKILTWHELASLQYQCKASWCFILAIKPSIYKFNGVESMVLYLIHFSLSKSIHTRQKEFGKEQDHNYKWITCHIVNCYFLPPILLVRFFFVIKRFICIYWKISACAWNQIAFSRVSFQWLLEKKKPEENFKKLISKCQEMGKIRRMETVTFASHVKHSECQDLSGNAFFKCISFW